jgi:hypothetical protein
MDRIVPIPAAAASALGCNTLHQGVAPDFLWVMDAARIVWPRKTADALHDVTGASIRTCKYWLAGAHAPSGLPLLKLLRALRRELQSRLRAVEALEVALN